MYSLIQILLEKNNKQKLLNELKEIYQVYLNSLDKNYGRNLLMLKPSLTGYGAFMVIMISKTSIMITILFK